MRSTAFKVAARLSLNFLSAHTEWVTNQNKSEATVVIYLDNAKAFGIVIYSKLLHKLYAYGIRDDLLKWIENFIGSHTQAVKINGVLTDFLPVTSGVVQGSVYGSQLFKLYINNLPEVIPPAVKIYLLADDTKITKIIRTIACRLLNVTGSSLFCTSGSAPCQLTLNIIKSIVQHLGISNPTYNYHQSGLTLELCDHIKDL